MTTAQRSTDAEIILAARAGDAPPPGLTGAGRWNPRVGAYNADVAAVRKLQAMLRATLVGHKLHVGFLGPSTTAGHTQQPSTTAWPVVLRNLLTGNRSNAVAGGTGFVLLGNTASPADSRVTLGSWTADTGVEALGTSGSKAWAKGGGINTTVTFTADLKGQGVGFLYDDAGGAFTWAVDGLAPVTVTPGGTHTIQPTGSSATAFADGLHTLVIKQTTSTAPRIAIAASNEPFGLQVTNLAVSGFDSFDAVNISSYDTHWNLVTALDSAVPFDVIVIDASLLINDANHLVARGVAASQANLLTLVQRCQALTDMVFLINMFPIADAWVDPVIDHLARRQAVLNVSDLTGAPILLDPTDRWSFDIATGTTPSLIANLSSVAAGAVGLNLSPNPHLTDIGNLDVAEAVAAAVAPLGGSGQVTAGDIGASPVIVHGATAGVARPNATSVTWIGTVAPTNGIAGDTWRDLTLKAIRPNIGGVWLYPPGLELAFAQRASSDTTTNTSRATASSNLIVWDTTLPAVVGTGQAVDIEFYCPSVLHSVAAVFVGADLVVNSVGNAEQLGVADSPVTTNGRTLILRRRKLLTAGTSYQFDIGKWVQAAGTGTYAAAAANPMSMSVVCR